MNQPDPMLESQMIQWRHDPHRHPELGFEETRTSDFVADKLQDFNIEVVRNIGKTGLVGILKRGDSDRSIGLRADMDVLKIHEANDFDDRILLKGATYWVSLVESQLQEN